LIGADHSAVSHKLEHQLDSGLRDGEDHGPVSEAQLAEETTKHPPVAAHGFVSNFQGYENDEARAGRASLGATLHPE
jgi:hypothetical protein